MRHAGRGRGGVADDAAPEGTRRAGRAARPATAVAREEIAAALEAPVPLLPHLPFLLQDLPSLSQPPALVVEALRQAGLAPGARVLDLGCGRGEIARAVAQAFAAQLRGIDAFAPFVAAARAAARAEGPGRRCRFELGDLRQALAGRARYDAVLLVALGPVLGDPAATVAALRRVVRPGGLLLIDDAYLDGAAPGAPWQGYQDRATTEASLTRHGDELVLARGTSAESAAFNRAARAAIRARAAELARARPRLRPLLDAYLARQEAEAAALAGPLTPMLWVLRRAVGAGRGRALGPVRS